MKRAAALLASFAFMATAAAGPAPKTRSTKAVAKPAAAALKVTRARVAIGIAGHTAREVVGRREEPLSLEEETAKQLEKLLRGPLRYGITGLYVADARTGEPLFAVNADDPLNPASNVKMISTATALELLGPDFRYTTRMIGPEPDAKGLVHGNVYLLGTWDPTLSAADLDEIATQAAARGIKQLDGDIVVGSDPTRDGLFRAVVPVEVRAGNPGEFATATAPAGFDLLTFKITAKTAKKPGRPHLTYTATTIRDANGHTRLEVAIGGTIGKGGDTMLPLVTKERTLDAAHALRAALRAHQITVTGDVHVAELGDFIGEAAAAGALPVDLGRHDSAPLADIVAHVNKWSINWLADRVIMTAAAISHRTTPTMQGALDAMYAWLARHPKLSKDQVLVDTGSGLSYHTRITPHELVAVVRSAAGYAQDVDPKVAHAWVDSLSIAGTDGTLRRRFTTTDAKGKLHGKTGSLSTVIALSGVLDLDPMRPLAFSIVTNGDRPLSKGYVRKAHEQILDVICHYLNRSVKSAPVVLPPPPPAADPAHPTPDDLEDADPDPALDAEAAGQP